MPAPLPNPDRPATTPVARRGARLRQAEPGPALRDLRWRLHRGGGRERAVRGRRRKRQGRLRPRGATRRPLASNMKLFTTATALSRLGPGRPDPDPAARDRARSTQRRPARQPLPEGGRRPGAGHPGFLQQLPRRPRHQSLRADQAVRAAGISAVTGRLYADDDIFDRLRGVADSGYATSPYIGPLSGLAFNSGFCSSQRPQLRLRPRPARRLEARPLAARHRVRVTARVALRKAPARARSRSASVRSPTMARLVDDDRRLLQQLLRRDADQGARRPLRRRRHHPRRRPGGRALRPQPRLRACTPSTARA